MLQQVGRGALAAFDSRQEWKRLVDPNPPELQELLKESARFADLQRYFRERNERLGAEIVSDVGEVHRLSISERVGRLRQIIRRLIERVNDAGEGTQSRH